MISPQMFLGFVCLRVSAFVPWGQKNSITMSMTSWHWVVSSLFLSCFSYGFCICFWLCICHCVSIRSTHYSDQDHKYLKSPIEGLVIVYGGHLISISLLHHIYDDMLIIIWGYSIWWYWFDTIEYHSPYHKENTSGKQIRSCITQKVWAEYFGPF